MNDFLFYTRYKYYSMILEMISYNIQYGRALEDAAAWVTGKSPDIFCLQEFPESEIGRFNPGYQQLFASSFNKKGRVYGELLAFKNTIQLVSAFGVDLGVKHPIPLISSSSGRRTALIANLETPIGNIVVGNIHLEWLARSEYKIHQLERVLAAINQAYPDSESPIILAGDYNYSGLFSGNGLRRYAGRSGYEISGDLNTHRFFGLEHQVDYVLYRSCLVKDIRIEEVNYSDHKPLLFTVSRNGG